MIKIFAVLLSVILLISCATTGELSKVKDFSIQSTTKVTVVSTVDPLNLVPLLESKLLNIGLDICPYEVAQKAIETSSSSSIRERNDSITVDSNSTTSATTYIPTSVVIDIKYNYAKYPAATYLTSLYIRLIDLQDKKILASFAYTGSEWVLAMPTDLLNDFIKKIRKFIM